jgi:hypothetical protein
MALLRESKERLVCKFTPDEKIQKGSELSELMSECSGLRDDLKSIKKGLEAQIAEKEARMNRLCEEIRTGQEFRLVPCKWVYGWEEGKKYCLRGDTMETVKTQDITDEERQTQLELDQESEQEQAEEQEQAAEVEADEAAAQEEEAAAEDEAEAQAQAAADEAAAAEAQGPTDAEEDQ